MFETREERVGFLERRQEGVGGSDLPPLIRPQRRSDGTIYRDVLDLYLEKVRPVNPDDAVEPDILRGLILEDPIAQLYSEFTGNEVRRMGRRVHPEVEHFQVHTDRQVLASEHRPEGQQSTGAMEAKAPRSYGFGNILEEGFPERYVAQLQWECACTGYDWGVIVAGSLEHSRGPLIWHTMERNERLIGGLQDLAHRFWTEHVEPRVAPDPDDWYGASTALEIPDVEGERQAVNTLEARRIAHRLMRRYLLRKRAKALYKDAKSTAKEFIEQAGLEDHERLLVPGQGKINWMWNEGRTSYKKTLDKVREHQPIDRDALARALANGEITLDGGTPTVQQAEALLESVDGLTLDIDALEQTGSPYRRFRPYPAEDEPKALPDPAIDPTDEEEEDHG